MQSFCSSSSSRPFDPSLISYLRTFPLPRSPHPLLHSSPTLACYSRALPQKVHNIIVEFKPTAWRDGSARGGHLPFEQGWAAISRVLALQNYTCSSLQGWPPHPREQAPPLMSSEEIRSALKLLYLGKARGDLDLWCRRASAVVS